MLSRRLARWLGGSVAALAAAACGPAAAPLERPRQLPPPPPAVAAAPAPPTSARWIRGGGATRVGPDVEGGTLLLLGGRRALVGRDGRVRGESAAAPEPIHELALVPAPSGRIVVGRGLHDVYRFDDPVGAPRLLARSELALASIGAGPGSVAVWDQQSDSPRFLDVAAGALRPPATLPLLPLRAIAFRSPTEGAAVFQVAGLAATTDGGATWRLAQSATPGDALRVNGIRLRGDELRAYMYAEGRDARVDVAAARLDVIDEPPPEAGDARMLRWVRTTGRDPLEAAIASGVALGGGGALVASHGLLARVDLTTGLVEDIAEFAHGGGVNSCSVARAGSDVYIGCALSEDADPNLYDPFGVLVVPAREGSLTAPRPALVRNGEAELRVSPSGGAMLLSPCGADDEGSACVHQPDGKWATIPIDVELLERGAGPLADGRVAFVRGVVDGDEIVRDAGKSTTDNRDAAGAPPADRGRAVQLSALDAQGKERPLGPPVSLRGEVRVQSPVEEDADHALTVVLSDDDGPVVVTQAPGREAGPLHRVEGAREARLHAGRGVALAQGKVLVSVDGGSTWTEAPQLPAGADRALQAPLDEPGALVVGDVGFKIDTLMRIGWGEPLAAAATPAPSAATTLSPRPTPSLAPERPLSCTSGAPVTGAVPPLLGSHQIRALLATKSQVAKGSRREVTASAGGRLGMLDVGAVLEETGSDGKGNAPTGWTLRWADPTEVGGRIHSWSGAPPKDVGWGSSLRTAAAVGGHALFSVRAGGKYALVRVRAGGGADIAFVPFDLLPLGDVALATHGDEVATWLHETQLVAWPSGGAPRAVAALAAQAQRSLGEPGRDGAPVLVGSTDWGLMGLVPFPKAAAAPTPLLTGWTPAPFVRRDAGRFAACAATSKGSRVEVSRPSGTVVVDGSELHAVAMVHELVVGQEGACVAAVSALLATAGRQGPHPIAFVRADLVKGRAEGGERGLGGPEAVRRMTCTQK